ncbi:MAG: hypothetical protein NHB32_17230 [Fischerella sp. CENA71]|nr:hypothetical protein [Fischerella sp. CENA71]
MEKQPEHTESPWRRPNGAEGHYGLWYLNDSGGYTRAYRKIVFPVSHFTKVV